MEVNQITMEQLVSHGMPLEESDHAVTLLNQWQQQHTPEICWHYCQRHLLTRAHPFRLHVWLYHRCYHAKRYQPFLGPGVFPDPNIVTQSNLQATMTRLGFACYDDLQHWSTSNPLDFWQDTLDTLNIQFAVPFRQLCDVSQGETQPHWFSEAKMNITASLWTHDQSTPAILTQSSQGPLVSVSLPQLQALSAQVSHGLMALQLPSQATIALFMPMNVNAIAIYLGIIQAGFTVMAIAESFSVEEIKTRLNLVKVSLLFSQDLMKRGRKSLPLYERVKQAAPLLPHIVVPYHSQMSVALQNRDLSWSDFLSDQTTFTPVACDPNQATHILFSSGTTGTPKAIPWTHTTPIKCAMDAYYHHNIQAGDVLCWPSSLGWMMGPWLIYAALLNGATLALYEDAPTTQGFGEFVTQAKVTLLGLVPSLVHAWRASHCMEACDWRSIKTFSSSGECSNSEDMLYLMYLADYKPIIEYCGGTEIGGAYLSNTILDPNIPACFSTPTLGLDFVLLNEEGQVDDQGEVALFTPSIGLSTTLLNFDHQAVYFSGMPSLAGLPPLRRHSDRITRLQTHCFRVEGRTDDSMNLSGIKVSSVEIERAFTGIESLIETAAISVAPNQGGPAQLIIYAVTNPIDFDEKKLLQSLQHALNTRLNPLFKIHTVCLIAALPRTASNKVMRQILRQHYQDTHP